MASEASSPVLTFEPYHAVLGGIAIGVAAFWNARLLGCVTGISGMLRSLFQSVVSRYFVAALFLSGFVISRIDRRQDPSSFSEVLPIWVAGRMVGAGLLVGFGTVLGNGCTSGHGVCGLSRFSLRSAISVVTFMVVAMLVTWASNTPADFGIQSLDQGGGMSYIPVAPLHDPVWLLFVGLLLPFLAVCILPYFARDARLASFLTGAGFGYGLYLAGMTRPTQVVSFLSLLTLIGPTRYPFNPTLLFVFVGALPLAYVGFRFAPSKPKLAERCNFPSRAMPVDWRLVTGAILFGIGWGLGGLCPGPAVVILGSVVAEPSEHVPVILFVLAMALGMLAAALLIRRLNASASTAPAESGHGCGSRESGERELPPRQGKGDQDRKDQVAAHPSSNEPHTQITTLRTRPVHTSESPSASPSDQVTSPYIDAEREKSVQSFHDSSHSTDRIASISLSMAPRAAASPTALARSASCSSDHLTQGQQQLLLHQHPTSESDTQSVISVRLSIAA